MQLWRPEFELAGKNKYRQLVPLLTHKDVSLIIINDRERNVKR